MSIIILLILVLASKTISASNPECENITYCECSENQLGDISSILISNNNLTFTIGVASWSNLQVDCNNLGWYEFNIIRKEFADVVDLVKFKNCHLPREFTLKQIVQMFGIEETNGLSFQSYWDLRKELKREHLEGFPNLTKLVLSNNGLTNISSDFLSNFAELEFLDLSENNLVLSKDNFKETLNLKQLDVNGNDIRQLPPKLFDNLNYLEILNVERNFLEDLDGEAFKELTSLKYLNLRTNFLSDLPEFVFSGLQNLETIDLSNNNFKGFPSNLFSKNNKLKKILLNENRGELKTLSNKFLNDLEHLEEVELRRNYLNNIPENLFWYSTSLKYIDLSENNFRILPESIFRNLQNIEKILISKNLIEILPDIIFTSVRKLKVLDLSFNRISIVQRNLFNGLTSLEELNMEGNGLKYIHSKAFSTNEQLSIAKFSDNRLQFSNPFNMLSPFYNNHLLKELHLSNNKIKYFYSDWTTNKLELELLDLRHNDISTISANDFIFSSDNVLVDLRYNNISNILLTNIEKLALYNTEKRNVTVHVENNPLLCDCHLYNLLRYYNGDMPITVYNFFELKLGNLTCVKNYLKERPQINQLDFKTYQCLEYDYFQVVDRHLSLCTSNIRPYDQSRIIDCSNKLKVEFKINKNTINLKGNYPLILNFTGNSLREIPSLDYIKPLNITHLLLSNNEISEISLDRLPKTIQVLELHNNNLINLNYAVSDFLFRQDFKVFTLSGNPFICDCDARLLYVIVLEKSDSSKDLRNVKCKDQNIPLVDMTVRQLCPSNDPPEKFLETE